MKRSLSVALAVFLYISTPRCQTDQKDFPVLKGPYLGQRPPGMTPEVFAPSIISTGLYTRDIAISKKGDEIYFSVSDAAVTAIFVTKLIDGAWTEPAIAPFSGKGFLDCEPHISADGGTLFFLSNRPPHDREPRNGWYYQNIWMVARTETGWSEPQLVDEPISTDENEFFPSMTSDSVLYFTRSDKNGVARIYRSKCEDGRFGKPEILPLTVPDKGLLFNAFVSPQDDYLITGALNIDSTNTDQDYYISFKTPEGHWGKLIKFGPEINTPGDNANSAYVSPDGRYLFFSSSRKDPSRPEFKSGTTLRSVIQSKSEPGYGSSAIYWVSAKIIANLKSESFK